jgi:hypothetical protein
MVVVECGGLPRVEAPTEASPADELIGRRLMVNRPRVCRTDGRQAGHT